MRRVIISMAAAVVLASCATTDVSDSDRLALYEAHAGTPVLRIDYRPLIGWTRVDDQHVAIDLRPTERWLLTLSGPCLRWNSAAPTLELAPIGGMVLSKFDTVRVGGSGPNCRIEEMRPIDVPAFRAAEQDWLKKR